MTAADRKKLMSEIQLHLNNSLHGSNLPHTKECRETAKEFQLLTCCMESHEYTPAQVAEHVQALGRIQLELQELDSHHKNEKEKARTQSKAEQRDADLKKHNID